MNSSSDRHYKGKKGLIRIWNALGYSRDGIRAAFYGEAAFRQLSLMAFILIPAALWFDILRSEKALLISSVLLSLIIELVNSAIEALTDRISPEYHELSKNAKDMGSAAQLFGLINIAVVWGLVLLV